MAPPIKPMIGDLELSLVQQIETDEEQVLVGHAVLGLAGNFTQRLNRNTSRVTLRGVTTGDEARDGLETLREKFHATEPLPFVADIMTATEVQQVLIADLDVQEVAGKPDRFEYRLILNEYIPPPPDEKVEAQVVNEQTAAEAGKTQDAVENQVELRRGTLEVTVEPGDTDADLSRVRIQVQGQTDDGRDYTVVLDEQTSGVFRKTDVPAGRYTVALLIT